MSAQPRTAANLHTHRRTEPVFVCVCVCVCLIETITEQVRPALADLRRKILKHQRICFKYFKLSGNFTICYCNFYYSSKQAFKTVVLNQWDRTSKWTPDGFKIRQNKN